MDTITLEFEPEYIESLNAIAEAMDSTFEDVVKYALHFGVLSL